MTIIKCLFATIGLSMVLVGSAFANDKCKNFSIKIINSSGYPAKVTKFQYYDYDKAKWRSEALTQRRLNNNIKWTWTRNLEHVKNDDTKFKVTWNVAGGPIGKWISKPAKYSNKFKCHSNGSKSLTLK